MTTELSEEQLLLQDVDSNSLRRRKRVRLEGYESDSSDSQEEAAGALDVQDFEKNLDEDVEDALQGISTNYDDVQPDDGAGDDDADAEAVQSYFNNPEDEVRDADRQRVKRAAPKLEAFSLKKEARQGTFDEAGGYTRRKPGSDDDSGSDSDSAKDPKDSWLEGLNNADIARARAAEDQRRQAQLQKQQAARAQAAARPKGEVLEAVVGVLQPAESVTEALQRLQKQRKLAQKAKQRESLVEIKRQVGQLTEDADLLLKLGLKRVYHMDREELLRLLARETGQEAARGTKRGHDDSEARPEAQPEAWEYKWSADDDEVYGPFPAADMAAWRESHFSSAVVVRRAGHGSFVPIDSVTF